MLQRWNAKTTSILFFKEKFKNVMEQISDFKFSPCGTMSQQEKGFDFVFAPDDQMEKERFQKRGQFLYLWKSKNAVLYVGITTNSIQNRMSQHKVGMRGCWENGHRLPGLRRPLVKEKEERKRGFGSASGGKKRRFLENAGIEQFEVWTAAVPPGENLRECENEVIWCITKEQIVKLKTTAKDCAEQCFSLCLNGIP